MSCRCLRKKKQSSKSSLHSTDFNFNTRAKILFLEFLLILYTAKTKKPQRLSMTTQEAATSNIGVLRAGLLKVGPTGQSWTTIRLNVAHRMMLLKIKFYNLNINCCFCCFIFCEVNILFKYVGSLIIKMTLCAGSPSIKGTILHQCNTIDECFCSPALSLNFGPLS